MQNKEVHAPYNFVPFSNVVLQRYENEDELPDYEKIDPQLKTGEIVVNIEAETPIYVSNGNSEKEDFFKGADGEYQIPGSSVRGMIRENMQILGFGLVRPGEDISDYQIYFRDMASGRGSVAAGVKDHYINALGIESKKINGKPVSIPQNVLAGYLYKEDGQFYIRPSRYIRVSRKNPGMNAFKVNGEIPPAMLRKVGYIEGENIIKEIVPVENKKAEMKDGILLSTGRPVGGGKKDNQKKENHLYVFEKETNEKIEDPIDEEDIISYREDWESRKNSLKAYYDPDFWKLPEEGESKPVFYIRYNKHTYFGMSLFLRIGYPHRISEGLPNRHKKLNEEGKVILDYPYAIMGFAKENEAYRSRISVGNFKLENGRRAERFYYVLGGEPKPSYYAGYLKNNGSYVDDDFTLRGYKQYWMRKTIIDRKPGKNINMEKKIRPFNAGAKFKGVIRFRNLHEDELGLLLWSLLLKDKCYQSLGMGAPYGFGRVKVGIEALREMDASFMYSLKGFGEGLQDKKEDMEKYILAYKDFAKNKIAASSKNGKTKDLEKRSEIEDFFCMRQISPLKEEEMDYMELPEYKNPTTVLKTVQQIREAMEESDKKTQSQENGPELIGGLDMTRLNKFGTVHRESKSKKRK